MGDRIAILSANSAEWVAAYLGVLHAGGVAVPLDTAYSAEQVAVVLADCDAQVIFVSARLEPTARTAAADLPRLRIVRLDADVQTASAPAAQAPVSASATAAILYTSGTTADPKGVVLTHGNLQAERDSALSVIRVDHRDVVLGVLPLFHSLAQMANLLLPLSAGSRVVFLDTIDSASLLAALRGRPVTVFACVPQFFYLIHQRVMAEIDKRGAVSKWVARGAMTVNALSRDWLRLNLGSWVFARVHETLGSHMRYLITGGSRFDPQIARDL
jgi:long-chain acyl-CoA synthetase